MSTEPPRQRSSHTRFKHVALGFVLLLAIGFSLAVVVHRRYVAYEPVASRHVPAGTHLVARFDLTHVMFYEPYRRAIASLVDRIPQGPSSQGRSARLETRGIRVVGDVREVLVAFGPRRGDWVAVLGGQLPQGEVAKSLAEVLREEGHGVEPNQHGFRAPGFGMSFGQADDSAFVMASDDERLQAALFGESLSELDEGSGGFRVEETALLPPATHARAVFRSGSEVEVEGDVGFRPGTPGVAQTALVGRLVEAVAGTDPAILSAIQRSSRTPDGNVTRVVLRLPREAVLGLADRAAAAILTAQDL